MHCIESGGHRRPVARPSGRLHLAGLAGVIAAMWLSGCGTRTLPPAAPATPSSPAGPAAPVVAPSAPAPGTVSPAAPAPAAGPSPTPAPGAGPGTRPSPPPPRAGPVLPVPSRVRSWEEYRTQAARRMVAAHPGGSYMGRVPEPLLAIPVLEVELQADGRVRDIRVLRQPGQARDTVQLAIAAVHRAAPFGPVEHLPRPWRFTEAFLFDDARRFKPRSLD